MSSSAGHPGYTNKGGLVLPLRDSGGPTSWDLTWGEWAIGSSLAWRYWVKFLSAQILGQIQPLVIVCFQLVGLDTVGQSSVVFALSFALLREVGTCYSAVKTLISYTRSSKHHVSPNE